MNPTISHSPEFTEPVLQGCFDVLQQCLLVIQQLTPEQYCTAPVGHSSVGAHVRHGVEHFQQLLNGVQKGRVDYDARERDLSLEQDSSVFETIYGDLIDQLHKLESTNLDHRIVIMQAPGKGMQTRPVASSVERELLFCSSHFMHHLAMMRLIAQLLGIQLSSEIGLAFSTAIHLAKLQANKAQGE